MVPKPKNIKINVIDVKTKEFLCWRKCVWKIYFSLTAALDYAFACQRINAHKCLKWQTVYFAINLFWFASIVFIKTTYYFWKLNAFFGAKKKSVELKLWNSTYVACSSHFFVWTQMIRIKKTNIIQTIH